MNSKKKRWLRYILSIGVLGAFLLWLRQSPLVKAPPIPQGGCGTHATFVESHNWQVLSSDVSVRMLWQKTEDRPALELFSGAENSGIAALPDHVVFHSVFWEQNPDAVLPSCTEQEIVAFDLLTGVLEWRYPLSQEYSRAYKRIYALSDGVLVVLDGILIKFDSDGQYVWSNEGFPSRSINIVYQDQNNLYLPSRAKFYVVSNETGQLLEEIDNAHPISVLNGNVVSAIDESYLQILLAGSQERYEIPVSDPNTIRNADIVPFTALEGDTLLVYQQVGYERSIEAYSLVGRKLLWKSEDYFEGLPVVSNNYVYASVYASETLSIKIMDVDTGNQIGVINLTATGEPQLDVALHEVWLAANDNILIVNIRDTWDIIALQIDA